MAESRGAAARVRRALRPPRAAGPTPPAGPTNSPLQLAIVLDPSEPVDDSRHKGVTLDELGPGHAREWDAVEIRAGSLAELRRAAPWLVHAGTTTELRVVVGRTDRPRGLRPPAAVGGRTVTAARLRRSPLTLEVTMARPTDVIAIVRAALNTGAAAGRPHPAAGLRLGVMSPAALSWVGGDPAAAGVEDTGTAGAEDYEVLLRGEDDDIPPVDIAVCSPLGFRPAGPDLADLSGTERGLELRFSDGACSTLDPHLGLTENHIRALREVRAVRLDPASSDIATAGRVIAQLCCAGVPVLAPFLPPALDAHFGPELAEQMRALNLDDMADPVARESWSVTTRRAALSRFSPWAYWAARGGPAPLPSVSVVLATRRPGLLPFALAQIARQDWPELEVVVVLHGVPADPGVRAAVQACPRPVQIVEVDADVLFGHALNAGLARCSGLLVTKMDDDDWYGPHHVTDLVQAHAHSGATLVGSSGYHVYFQTADVTMRWTKVATEAPATWVHGGTMLLAAADLHSLGAWPGVSVGEDAHVLRAVRAASGLIYGIHDLGFCYYRGGDSTWNPGGGDARWLESDVSRVPGFAPPPQLDPLPHPWLPSPR